VRGGTGVALPDGGCLTDQTAAAAASAAALVWLQRRRRYLPRPPGGADRTDPDLAPLPDTVAAIEDRRHRDADDDEVGRGEDMDATPVARADPAAIHPAVVGQRAGEPLEPRALPAGGVGLTGEGALAAARGVLTATLLSGDPWQPADDARIITTVADLDAVLGGPASQHHTTPGLTVATNLDDALATLEQAALARSQSTTPGHNTGGPAVEHGGRGGTVVPPIVLVAGCPAEPADARRLAFILTMSAHLGIAGVLLGRWVHGATWLLDADGVSHPAEQPATVGPRLCVLTAAATADLLTVLREARSNRNPPDPSPAPTPLPRQRRDHAGPTPAAPGQRRQNDAAGAASAVSSPPAVTASLQARLLGSPAILCANGMAIPIRRTAALQVLTFLAVHPAGATSNQLIAALWPGPRPHAAAGRLYTPVSELRLALQEAAGGDVLVRVGDRYRLDERHIDVDLWRLRSAVDAAAAAVHPPDRTHALRAIVDGYTGELAAGRQWPWLAAPRETIRRHVIDACVTLAGDEPDPHTALALLQEALRVDPVNEELHRRTQQAQAATNHPVPGRPR